MREREQGGMWDARSPVHTVGLCRGGEDEQGEPNPPLLVSLPILLPISSHASSCNPWVPPPMPPQSLLPSPRWLLTVLVCQCRTGAYLSKARGGVEGGRRCRRWVALALSIRRGVRVGCRWFWGFDGVQDVKGGWGADLGVFGWFVVGSGLSTAFAGWRVAV